MALMKAHPLRCKGLDAELHVCKKCLDEVCQKNFRLIELRNYIMD